MDPGEPILGNPLSTQVPPDSAGQPRIARFKNIVIARHGPQLTHAGGVIVQHLSGSPTNYQDEARRTSRQDRIPERRRPANQVARRRETRAGGQARGQGGLPGG